MVEGCVDNYIKSVVLVEKQRALNWVTVNSQSFFNSQLQTVRPQRI